MTLLIAGGTQSTGYDIDNSIRLNDDDSHNISNNPTVVLSDGEPNFQ